MMLPEEPLKILPCQQPEALEARALPPGSFPVHGCCRSQEPAQVPLGSTNPARGVN